MLLIVRGRLLTCPECREGCEELAEQQLFAQDLLDVLLAFHWETLPETRPIKQDDTQLWKFRQIISSWSQLSILFTEEWLGITRNCSHPVGHEEVQPSLLRALHDKVAEGRHVLWPGDVSVALHSSLTCKPAKVNRLSERSISVWGGDHFLGWSWCRADHSRAQTARWGLRRSPPAWSRRVPSASCRSPWRASASSTGCTRKSLRAPHTRRRSRGARPCGPSSRGPALKTAVAASAAVQLGLRAPSQRESKLLKWLTPCGLFGLVNILSKQWSMLDIFIAALNTGDKRLVSLRQRFIKYIIRESCCWLCEDWRTCWGRCLLWSSRTGWSASVLSSSPRRPGYQTLSEDQTGPMVRSALFIMFIHN